MKTQIILFLLLFIAIVKFSHGKLNLLCPKNEERDMCMEKNGELTKSMGRMAYKLFKQNYKKGENFVISPLSIYINLASLTMGSKGDTEEELLQAIGFDYNSKENHEIIGNWMSLLDSDKLNGLRQLKLKVANQVYIMKSMENTIKSNYKQMMQSVYQSTLDAIEFSNANEAAKIMNAKISQITNGLINELVESDSLDANTRLVGINAIYFAGKWKKAFKSIGKLQFTLENGETIEAQTMNGKIRCLTRDDRKGESKSLYVLLPMKDSQRFVFTLAIPEEGVHVDDAMQSILSVTYNEDDDMGEEQLYLSNLMSKLSRRPTHFNLTMPKFNLKTNIDLIDSFKSMGINEVFDQNKADLSGMSTQQLFVDHFVHESVLKINESGIEAAGGTSFGASFRSLPRYVDLVIDRPFNFFLWDRMLKLPLFMGTVENPSL